MAGEAFLSAIGQTAAQGAGQAALNTASQGLLSQLQTLGTPAITQGIMSQLANLGQKGLDFAMSDQGINLLSAGGGILKGLSDRKQGKKLSNLYDRQFAMSQDAYNRDKEADQKRQLLNF